MKRLFILLAATLLTSSIHSQQTNSGSFVEIKFPDGNTIDFGTMQEGFQAVKNINFVNTGNEPLNLSLAKSSCGCIIAELPKQAIGPGASANIKVSFNSIGRGGEITKTLTIQSNARNGAAVLTIKAKVVPKRA